MDRAAYAGLSLFKHARHTLGSHCSGLAGLIVFEYLVFKHSLSKVPMNHSETIPLYSLIFSKCLLVSTVLFSCAALFASASYMMIDYARRVAIDKGMTMGLALQLPVEGIQGSWLGSVTVLLACLNMAILIFDLMCTEISETSHSERGLSGLFSNDFCAELVARVGPLLFYMLNLRDIARSPKISWYRYQKLMQNPCSVDELLGSLGSRSGELTAPPSCPRQCWTSFLSLLGVKPPQRASEGIEMQHFSDRERSSRISEGFSHVRPGASLIGAFLILAFGLCIGLPGLYKHAFVPQASIVRVIGATGEQCYESDVVGSDVACWIVPEEARNDVTIIWHPDITLASSFYFCPMD
eukprot:symbB.v1.2.039323.t1/scaffold6487.1/size17701/1